MPTVRVTVPVRTDVLDTFKRMASACSMSTGRAMGDWLADTLEAAQLMTEKLEQARAAPRVVAREMHAYALGLADETGAVLDQLRNKGRSERAPGQAHADQSPAPGAPSPRYVIRGGKSHGKNNKTGGKSL